MFKESKTNRNANFWNKNKRKASIHFMLLASHSRNSSDVRSYANRFKEDFRPILLKEICKKCGAFSLFQPILRIVLYGQNWHSFNM